MRSRASEQARALMRTRCTDGLRVQPQSIWAWWPGAVAHYYANFTGEAMKRELSFVA